MGRRHVPFLLLVTVLGGCAARTHRAPGDGMPRVPSAAPAAFAAPDGAWFEGVRDAALQEGGGSDTEALAKQLANPVASLISVPFQFNFDQDIGPTDAGERWVLNVQPVVPFSLDEDWNLISRTIVPIIDQSDIPPGNDETGFGDVLQSLFFSPVEPTEGGWIWGAGPVFLLPTASDETLGQEQWAIGPTAVFLKQDGPWTYGALANHLWGVASDKDRHDVNATFLQPFLAYTTPEAITYSINTESTYDWREDDLAMPVNVGMSKVTRWGEQLVSVGGFVRTWVETTDTSPEGIGFRFIVTLLYPRSPGG